MTWLRIEGRMPQHYKVAPLSDAAFRLHITAMAWSVESLTDGKIPFLIPQTLTSTQRGMKLRKTIEELVSFGLWIEVEGSWQIHDFLEWNISAAEMKARRETKARAGQVGGARSAQARAKQNPSTCLPSAVALVQPWLKQNASPYPIPYPERDPPTPSVLAPQGADPASGVFPAAPEVGKAKTRKPRQPQWRRFPPDFEPDDSHRKLAAELGLNLGAQLAEIRDHEFKSPKSDAAATLRTWLRNAPKFGAGTLGAARQTRLDPRNEAQDRNAEHEARKELAYIATADKRRAEYEAAKRLFEGSGGQDRPRPPTDAVAVPKQSSNGHLNGVANGQ